MGNMSVFDSIVERKLMDLHCAYIGIVLKTDGKTAKVQPLGLIKKHGDSAAKAQAVVDNVPVACRYKFKEKEITYLVNLDGGTRTQKIVEPTEIEAGDLVVCLCTDRNIDDARRGNNVLPPAGRHSISDSIIVGIL